VELCFGLLNQEERECLRIKCDLMGGASDISPVRATWHFVPQLVMSFWDRKFQTHGTIWTGRTMEGHGAFGTGKTMEDHGAFGTWRTIGAHGAIGTCRTMGCNGAIGTGRTIL